MKKIANIFKKNKSIFSILKIKIIYNVALTIIFFSLNKKVIPKRKLIN